MLGLGYRKANPTDYTLHYSNGKVRREGVGLSFFYFAPSSTIVSVPLESVSAPFVFNEPTADFQTMTVQGQITYRIADPKKAAAMLDFTLNAKGHYASDQYQKLPERLVYALQTIMRAEIQAHPLRAGLTAGGELTVKVIEQFRINPDVTQLGVEILSLSILSLRPTPDMAKALEAEAREALNRAADQAVYTRRNAAIEQERKLKENEIETELLVQSRQRELREREMAADIAIETQKASLTEQKAENERKEADVRAYALKAVIDPIRTLDWRTLTTLTPNGGDARTTIAMAFQELAANAQKVGELNISPDLLRSLVGPARG